MHNITGNSGFFDSDLLFSETERKLGPPPRHLDLDERFFILGCTWAGLRFRWAGDKLYLVFEWRKRLLREGNVALGWIVQANSELFSPGDYEDPAQVVYCSDRTIPNLLETLATCADRIFALKHTKPEQLEERKLAESITDEYRREMRLAVPKAIAEIEDVTLTTLWCFGRIYPTNILRMASFRC